MKTLTRVLVILTLFVCTADLCKAQVTKILGGKVIYEVARAATKINDYRNNVPTYIKTPQPSVRLVTMELPKPKVFNSPTAELTRNIVSSGVTIPETSYGQRAMQEYDEYRKTILQKYSEACEKYRSDSIADFELIKIGQYATMTGLLSIANDCFAKYIKKCSDVPSVLKADLDKYMRLTESLSTMTYRKVFLGYMPALMDKMSAFAANCICTDLVNRKCGEGLPAQNGTVAELEILKELAQTYAKDRIEYCDAILAIYYAKDIDECYNALAHAVRLSATVDFCCPEAKELSTELMSLAIVTYASVHNRVPGVLALYEEPLLAQHARRSIGTAFILYVAALKTGDERADTYYRYGIGIDAERFRSKVAQLCVENIQE